MACIKDNVQKLRQGLQKSLDPMIPVIGRLEMLVSKLDNKISPHKIEVRLNT